MLQYNIEVWKTGGGWYRVDVDVDDGTSSFLEGTRPTADNRTFSVGTLKYLVKRGRFLSFWKRQRVVTTSTKQKSKLSIGPEQLLKLFFVADEAEETEKYLRSFQFFSSGFGDHVNSPLFIPYFHRERQQWYFVVYMINDYLSEPLFRFWVLPRFPKEIQKLSNEELLVRNGNCYFD